MLDEALYAHIWYFSHATPTDGYDTYGMALTAHCPIHSEEMGVYSWTEDWDGSGRRPACPQAHLSALRAEAQIHVSPLFLSLYRY